MSGDLPAAVAETHSATVVFLGDRAYKLKKPVDLGFLDFRTREARQAVLRRELELNRRLTPDVYLDVVDVVDAGGEPCEHLLVMRRMPADRRLSTLVEAGSDVDLHLRRLAHLLAAFHSRAERAPAIDEAASPGATRTRWSANTAEMHRLPGDALDGSALDRAQVLAERYIAGRSALFQRRIDDGRVCDGHGDLLADDVFCLDDGPRVLDCIEFDDALRHGDVLADVAFLAMDLERLGRADLAQRFLGLYREHAGDTWPTSLAHHHLAYRAQVRAKVAVIRAAQGAAGAAGQARRLLDMVLDHLHAGVVRLVLVGGLPGTGKSTLAAGLAEAIDGALLRSDVVRKELAGIPADRPATAAVGGGIYDRDTTARTYSELLRRAGVALALGQSVVVDASFSDPHWRFEAAAVGEVHTAELAAFECSAPPGVAAERIAARRAAGGDPSDATAEVAQSMATAWAPWPEATVVDTDRSAAEALEAALASFGRT